MDGGGLGVAEALQQPHAHLKPTPSSPFFTRLAPPALAGQADHCHDPAHARPGLQVPPDSWQLGGRRGAPRPAPPRQCCPKETTASQAAGPCLAAAGSWHLWGARAAAAAVAPCTHTARASRDPCPPTRPPTRLLLPCRCLPGPRPPCWTMFSRTTSRGTTTGAPTSTPFSKTTPRVRARSPVCAFHSAVCVFDAACWRRWVLDEHARGGDGGCGAGGCVQGAAAQSTRRREALPSDRRSPTLNPH